MKIPKEAIKLAFIGNEYQRHYGSFIITKQNQEYQENLINNKYALIKYKGNKHGNACSSNGRHQ